MKHYPSPHFLSIAALLGVLILGGCASDLVSDAAEETTPRTEAISKLRMGHLLDQALHTSDGAISKKKDRATLILGLDDTQLSGNKLLRRYKLLTRYKLLSRYEYDEAFFGAAVEIDAAALDSFLLDVEDDPDVAWVEPGIRFSTMPGKPDFLTSRGELLPWGVEHIGGGARSQAGATSEVDLYILDSGVASQDLHVVEELSFQPQGGQTKDRDGHGTHIAGTAAALANGSEVVGVAPGVCIHSLKVLAGNGEADLAEVIAAIEYVTKAKKANPSRPMVVNLSLGADIGTTTYNAMDQAIAASIRAGVVYVLSAGNDGIDAATVTPAHVEEAITVGAYDAANRFAAFSNHGPVVDLLAPGVDIVSLDTQPSNSSKSRLAVLSGTSMAAPHVAGAAALYLSRHPDATPAEVHEALLAAARPSIVDAPARTTNRSVWVGGF